jgi:hypothetical protein
MGESALDRLLLVDRAGLAPLLDGPVGANSDFYPVLDLGAERARFLQRSAAGVVGLGSGVVDYLGDPALRPTTWDAATSSPLMLAPQVRAMLRAAQLRQGGRDSAWTDEPGTQESYLYRSWSRVAEGSLPPASWRGWAGDFWTIRGVLSGGEAPADSSFFSRARRYALRTGAPRPVGAVIEFGERLARRDLPAARDAAEVLMLEAKAGRFWIPADDLLDGTVRSLLAAGRPDRARAAMDLFRPHSTRARDDLRLGLLGAYLERAETGAAPPAP